KQARYNILYPKRYKKLLPQVFADMKAQGVESVVMNGDITNKDTPGFARNVRKIAFASGLDILWTRGNHDLRKTSKYYFPGGSYYYYEDRGDWRIIVLDSNYIKPNGWGGVDDPQVEWLKIAVAEASGSVIVFMHHPIFMINEKRPDDIYPGYTYLESALSESGKVKYVISGHVHLPYQFGKSLNDVQYYANIPLALKGHLNSYQVIDLKK
ncbi:MAG: metallophosphoesterase, partial [Candidatus Moraniibacteriota bacterium]